jgi:hypothetical protein
MKRMNFLASAAVRGALKMEKHPMATIKLENMECKGEILPKKCVKCAAVATTEKRVPFTWQPPWIAITILAGLLVYVVLSMVLRKQRTVYLPVCDDHKGSWQWHNVFLWVGLAVIVSWFIFTGVLTSSKPPEPVIPAMFIAGGVSFLLLLIIGIVWSNRVIKPTLITDDVIHLKNIHQDFADTLEEERDRDYEEFQARKAAKRRARGGGE